LAGKVEATMFGSLIKNELKKGKMMNKKGNQPKPKKPQEVDPPNEESEPCMRKVDFSEEPVSRETDELDELASKWEKLKNSEVMAQSERLDVEDQILALQEKRDEGAIAQKTRRYKITTTYKMNRKLDLNKWDEIKENIPRRFHPVRYKPELDLKAYRQLEIDNREHFLAIAKHVVATPAKPSIKVEILK
jgi:hypothetical protein